MAAASTHVDLDVSLLKLRGAAAPSQGRPDAILPRSYPKQSIDELVAQLLLDRLSVRVRPYFLAHKSCIINKNIFAQECQRARSDVNVAISAIGFFQEFHCKQFSDKFLKVARALPFDDEAVRIADKSLWTCVDARINYMVPKRTLAHIKHEQAVFRAARDGETEPVFGAAEDSTEEHH